MAKKTDPVKKKAKKQQAQIERFLVIRGGTVAFS